MNIYTKCIFGLRITKERLQRIPQKVIDTNLVHKGQILAYDMVKKKLNYNKQLLMIVTCQALRHCLALRHWNTGLVSSRVSLTSWEEGASLALVSHPSSDGITITIPYGVDVLLYRPALHPFTIGLVKTKSDLLLDHSRQA